MQHLLELGLHALLLTLTSTLTLSSTLAIGRRSRRATTRPTSSPRKSTTVATAVAGTNQPRFARTTRLPVDHGERVALFRARVLGPLTCADLNHGEQAVLLREISRQRFRPPGLHNTRRYGVSTLERWLGHYRKGGLEALRPGSRATGNARALSDEQRQLIIEIRREHRGASVPLIMETLIAEGRVERGAVKASAIRRLLASEGLRRELLARDSTTKTRTTNEGRRRWQVERPGQLWHADVCHGPSLRIDGRKVPLRIHGFLDDASRFVPVLAARSSEREVDMLELFVAGLREHGMPKVLYLDNGSTYRGKILETACARLGITLLHAAPYDPCAGPL